MHTGWKTKSFKVRVLKVTNVILLHIVQTGSRVQPTNFPMGIGDFFPGV
jgi:hypothetical protein